MATCADTDIVNFTEYEKMPQHTNGWVSKNLDAIKEWVALEKVHGANLSFTAQLIDGEVTVKAGRRTAYLEDGESFFSVFHRPGFIVGETEKVKKLFQEVCRTIDNSLLAVTVYGELFGGEYPHPDVPAVPSLRPVQKEVFYCPDLKFMAYDITLLKSPLEEDRCYLDHDVCVSLFKSSGLFYTEPLLIGTLQKMLDYPLNFNSTIPKLLGLPPLPEGVKNNAEGIVIKPRKNIVLEKKKEPARVIFKRKSELFSETVAVQKRGNKEKTKPVVVYDAEYEAVKCELVAMVTHQRLQNVISKIGRPNSMTDSAQEIGEKWKKIHGSLSEDILGDVQIDHEEMWTNFKKTHSGLMGKIKGELKRECNALIKVYKEQNKD